MTALDSDAVVLRHDRDGYAVLTLNRPQRLNALTAPMLQTLRGTLAAVADDPAVRAVVVTGAGRGFCAGQDLTERDPRGWTGPPDLAAIQRDLYHPVLRLMAEMAKPVICAVNGIAAGAGASLALAGDIVFAARSATLSFSFARVGLSADAGAGWRLVQAVGAARARGLLMTAEPVEAARAAEWGLVWQVVSDGELAAEAAALAQRLAAGPTIAFGQIKRAVMAAEGLDFAAYLEAEAALQGIAGRSADYREGVLAFLEKRPPGFAGR